ncbi:MAG: hypothetical protein G01um101413_370 [Parcubacteria group bacterium Gr01-1014_13]|nr:MAG: hypothetical protein G01um101413_370 [Parcubacteria group bacterium Gr01-1014_13]
MPTTVKEIREEFLIIFPGFWGCKMDISDEEVFLVWEKLDEFWKKLHRLGSHKTDSIPLGSVPDIDAVAVLTDEECDDLHNEMIELKKLFYKFRG